MSQVLIVEGNAPSRQALARLIAASCCLRVVSVASPTEALAVFEASEPALMIAELEYPGAAEGEELLSTVRARFPRTARFAHSARVLGADTPDAHQFFDKPCPPERLTSAVLRVTSARRDLADQTLQAVASGANNLPPAPATYAQLSRAVERGSDLTTISKIIARDPAVSTRLLQLVNSAFYSRAVRVQSVHQATSLLGARLIRAIALSEGVFEWATDESEAIGHIHESANRMAERASALAPRSERDGAFATGLLHNVGQLLASPDQSDVARLGAYALHLWGLPESIANAVGRQRQEERPDDDAITLALKRALAEEHR